MAAPMGVMVFAMAVLFLALALFKWNELKHRHKGLPPGTMGWPIVGETRKFLKQGPHFMRNQRARYGSFFKSHLLGCPTVVCMDPEINRYILLNEAKGLVPGYPISMVELLGKRNIAALYGSSHKHMRGALHSIISPTMIRDHILPASDHFMKSYLTNWDCHVIDLQEKTKKMAFLNAWVQIAGVDANSTVGEIMPEFLKLEAGTISLPINLPTTNYHRGFEGRRNVVKILEKLIEKRRASKEKTYNDILGFLLKDEDNKYKLNVEEIIDLIVSILNSGYETVSVTSMMAAKYLHDHPQALDELRKEQLEIRAKRKPNDPLTWEDCKSMKFTRAVILETSRLATIVNGVMRRTTHDMELNGYFIPKGWRIYIYVRELNHSESLYADPYTFSPWRWLDRSVESHPYSLLFGGGPRMCPGKELAMVEISTFLHYLVIGYRWDEVPGNKLDVFPRVMAPNGLHYRFWNLDNN